MRMVLRSLLAASIAVLASACATSSGAGDSGRAAPAERNRIAYEEIQLSQHGNLYDFIRSARPQWFRQQARSMTQGSKPGQMEVSSASTPRTPVEMQMGGDALQIFMDGRRLGGTDVLNSIPVAQAREIRYYSQSEAASRFSLGTAAPAIEIITRTQ